MSQVKVNGQHGFIGFNGVPVLLEEHDVYDANDPIVQARPELFDEVPEPVKRPILSRKPGKGADD